MKKKCNALVAFIIFVFCCLILFYLGKNFDIGEAMGLFLSASIATIGWIYSSHINNVSFQRSEIIKSKDHIIELLNTFFDDLVVLIHQGKTEQEIEYFITNSISSIEMKVEHLKIIFKEKQDFISDDLLMNLRDKPQDFIENYNHKVLIRNLNKLKDETLQEIEEKYKKWLKDNCDRII